MHKEGGHGVAIEHDCENPLHGFHLGLVSSLLQLHPQVGDGGDIGGVILVHQAVGIFEKGCHGGWCLGPYDGASSIGQITSRKVLIRSWVETRVR